MNNDMMILLLCFRLIDEGRGQAQCLEDFIFELVHDLVGIGVMIIMAEHVKNAVYGVQSEFVNERMVAFFCLSLGLVEAECEVGVDSRAFQEVCAEGE